MCSKCKPHYTEINCRIETLDKLNTGEPVCEIEVNKDVLDVYALWFDEVRETQMALRTQRVIKYCPWCGRKLEE